MVLLDLFVNDFMLIKEFGLDQNISNKSNTFK